MKVTYMIVLLAVMMALTTSSFALDNSNIKSKVSNSKTKSTELVRAKALAKAKLLIAQANNKIEKANAKGDSSTGKEIISYANSDSEFNVGAGSNFNGGISKGKLKTNSTVKKTPTWSGSVSIDTNTTEIDAEEPTQISGLYTIGIKRYFASQKVTAGLKVGYEAQYTHLLENNRSGEIQDTGYSVDQSIDVSAIDTLSIGLGGKLATSRTASMKSFKGSIGPSIKYSKKFGILAFNQHLAYRRSFYDYSTTGDNKINSPDLILISTGLGFELTKTISLGTSAGYNYSLSYDDVATSSTEIGASLDWKTTEQVSASLGVSTVTGTLAPNGEYHRIVPYDTNLSTAFINLTLTL